MKTTQTCLDRLALRYIVAFLVIKSRGGVIVSIIFILVEATFGITSVFHAPIPSPMGFHPMMLRVPPVQATSSM
jgi:hypothetical protein